MERQQAIEEIRRQYDCRQFLQKSKSGLYCCPFCGSGSGRNGTGAMKYYPETNTCACFAGCAVDSGQKGKSYDVLDLLQKHYGCDFNTAVKMGADALRITIDNHADAVKERAAGNQTENAGATPTKSTTEQQTTTEADYTAYYEYCRKQLYCREASFYLSARGIRLETAAACGIGFDPAADPANAPGAMGNEYRPHPCPRIIIPTSKGHYVGRRIEQGEYAKINAKGSTPAIFNADILKTADAQEIFITEGAFDALSVIEAGGAALALNSANNAALLLQILEKQPTAATFVISLDSDKAGENGAAALIEGFTRLQIPFITADINCGKKDANEALTADRTAFTAAVQAAQQQAHQKGAESPTAAAGDYLTDFLEKIQGEAYKPYKTGLTFFDDLLGGGLTRQQILLLMAAPAAGKTTLAQQIAESMAANKKPVIYLNLEMSREQMLAKAISSRLARKKDGRVFMNTMQILQGYNWTDEQRTAVTAEVEEYRQEIFPYLRYNPDGTSSDLTTIREYLNQIGKKEREKGNEAPAVVLDYLHLVSDSKLETQELLKQTMTVLKDYAVEYNTCAIGITASNRKSNEKGNLTMESGRDSSNLEYGADIVLSLNYYLIDSGKVKPTDNEKIAQLQQEALRQMIIRVLKGRFVTPGKTARVYFSAAYNTFYGESEWMPAGLERIPFEEPKKATPANRI